MSRQRRWNKLDADPYDLGVSGSSGSNRAVYNMYMAKLCELAMNRFRWEFPDGFGITSRFMERWLLRSSYILFYQDSGNGRFFTVPGANHGELNMYGNPTSWDTVPPGGAIPSVHVYSQDGVTADGEKVVRDKAVPIYCNQMRIPDIHTVAVYADKLAEIDRTITINLQNQRKPFIASVPNHRRSDILNIIRSYEDGDPVLFGTEELNIDNTISVWPTNIHPDLVPKTMIAKKQIWNEAMTMLGIDNANQDKRERLVESEVDANSDQVNTMRSSLLARQEACLDIQRVFGVRVWCEWNTQETTQSLGTPVDTAGTLTREANGGWHE